MNDLAQRVFNRTKFMQVMKYSVINYWGCSWDKLKEFHINNGEMDSLKQFRVAK